MTAAEIQAVIDEIYAALLVVPGGKSYTINLGGTSRSVTRQDMKQLREELNYWQLELAKKNSSRQGIPTKFITPQE